MTKLTISKVCKSLAVCLALFLAAHVSSAYEQSVKCRSLGDPDPSVYPYESTVVVGPSETGRAVSFTMSWKAVGLQYINGYGLEMKMHQYNYDDAAMTGKGPACITGPVGEKPEFCTLPGCYVDSDFLSEKNSNGEYQEPQVAIGVEPEMSTNIVPEVKYYASISSVPGRGNSSLMKVLYYTTTRVAPIGVSGIFHCSDVTVKNILRF